MKGRLWSGIFLVFILTAPTAYARTEASDKKPFQSFTQVIVGKIARTFGNPEYAEAKFRQALSLDDTNQNAKSELQKLYVETGKKARIGSLPGETKTAESQTNTRRATPKSVIIREKKDMFGRPAGTYEKSLKELSEKSKFVHPKSVRVKNARAYRGSSGASSSRSSGDIGVVHRYLINSSTGERREMSAAEAVSQGYEKQV